MDFPRSIEQARGKRSRQRQVGWCRSFTHLASFEAFSGADCQTGRLFPFDRVELRVQMVRGIQNYYQKCVVRHMPDAKSMLCTNSVFTKVVGTT
jgi:hypothetical protein